MVGYHQNDTLTTSDKLVAGTASGVVTRLITQPLDVIKLRIQLQKQRKSKPNIAAFYTTAKILKHEGFSAFYHGHIIGQMHSIVAVSSQFYVYELATQFVATTGVSHSYRKELNFLCGMLAGTCSAAIVNPLEVIRVRQMVARAQYRGVINGARQVFKTGGISAFYGGLSASILQMGPATGISFGTFSLIQPIILRWLRFQPEPERKKYEKMAVDPDLPVDKSKINKINKHPPENILLASSIAGSIAGVLAKLITYPFELTKRRLQMATHKAKKGVPIPKMSRNIVKCKSITSCVVETVKKEGFLGLYRGWRVTVAKAQVTSIVAFTSYEIFCYILRELGADKVHDESKPP